jgi:hypothetical protein
MARAVCCPIARQTEKTPAGKPAQMANRYRVGGPHMTNDKTPNNVSVFPKTPFPRPQTTCTVPMVSYLAMITLTKSISAMMKIHEVNISGPNAEAFKDAVIAAFNAYEHLRNVDQMIERQVT